MASAKRNYLGRLWAGLQYAASLFRGTGDAPDAPEPIILPHAFAFAARETSIAFDGRSTSLALAAREETAAFDDRDLTLALDSRAKTFALSR